MGKYEMSYDILFLYVVGGRVGVHFAHWCKLFDKQLVWDQNTSVINYFFLIS